jgi:hypothetical protein
MIVGAIVLVDVIIVVVIVITMVIVIIMFIIRSVTGLQVDGVSTWWVGAWEWGRVGVG